MCDVCCASKALEETATLGESMFTWNPKGSSSGLINNHDAPPLGRLTQDPLPDEWPRIYVQARRMPVERLEALVRRIPPSKVGSDGSEGPGQVRFRFTKKSPWSDWVETDCIATVMLALQVDIGLKFVPKDHPIRGNDIAALYAKVNEFAQGCWANHLGSVAGKGLTHAGKIVPDRLVTLDILLGAKGDESPKSPLAGIDPLYHRDWFAGVLSGLRGGLVTRAKRPRSSSRGATKRKPTRTPA